MATFNKYLTGSGQSGDCTGGFEHVVDPTQVPRNPITPTVGGTSMGEVYINPASGEIFLVRLTYFTSIGTGDSVVAANRLATGYPDVTPVYPDKTVICSVQPDGSEGEITDVYAAILCRGGTVDGRAFITTGEAYAVPDGATDLVGCFKLNDANFTPANMLAGRVSDSLTGLLRFQFDAADKVRDFMLSLRATVGSDESYLTIGGRGYA